MENIQIRKIRTKSIQSLIDESAIDNSFNFQAYQLRKAFTENIKKLTANDHEKSKQIDKLKVQINQLNQDKQSYANKILQYKKITEQADRNCKQMGKLYEKSRRRTKFLQQKLQTYAENRAQVQAELSKQEQFCQGKPLEIKKQLYKELVELINRKIRNFTEQLKNYAMSSQLQSRIQSFLEQLVYLNPHSDTLNPFINYNSRQVGKISSNRKNHINKIQDITKEQEWKRLEKSLQKLKEVSKNKTKAPFSLLQGQNVSPTRRSRTPNSLLKSKKRIFNQTKV